MLTLHTITICWIFRPHLKTEGRSCYFLSGPEYFLLGPEYFLLGPEYFLLGPEYLLLGPDSSLSW